MHGHAHYHYHMGRFYRPWSSGFILVRPPLGLVVVNIPLGSWIFVSAGVTYYVYGDVYYRRVPMGYEVVEPVRAASQDYPGQVEVVIPLLDVYYGPDENEEIIAQVEEFTILDVLGIAPGWLYVSLPDSEIQGWVQEEYVTRDLELN